MQPLRRYRTDPEIAEIGALIGHPARAAMLFALLDGGELPASELASRGGVSPSSASAHLAKLVGGGLLRGKLRGRQKLFQLGAPDVASAIEALCAIAPPPRGVALSQNLRIERLREARSCYDHLAGRLGVAVTDALVARGAIRLIDGSFDVTRSGERFFDELGVDLIDARARRRSFARACRDWTERRLHMAGSLGAALHDRFISAGWVERDPRDRGLAITALGRHELATRFGLALDPETSFTRR